MGNIKIDIDVQNKRIDRDIKSNIEDGIEKGATQLAQESKEVAQNRIRSVGAIFTGDLILNFNVRIEKRRNKLVVILENNSDHAAPIEFGAEYGAEGPPVVALIPWVKAKMSGFQVPEDDLSELPTPDEVDEDTTVPEPGGDEVDLLNVADRSTIQKAFWLQQHIKEEGIDAVRFMKAAEKHAQEDGPDTIADYISREIKT